MIIAAYVLGVLGLALAFLVALAAGMKTVPRFTEGDLVIALGLPVLAVLLAVISISLGGEDGRRPIANGGALLLSVFTILFVLHSWAFQPSKPALIQTVQKKLGMGRWKPDTTRWASDVYVVEAEEGDSVVVQESEREILLGGGVGSVRWRRRLICRDQNGEVVSGVIVSVNAVLSVLFDHCGLIVRDTLYMGMGDHLTALRLPDLEKRWELLPATGGVYSLQRVEDDVLAICEDGASRFDSEGTIIWERGIHPNHATGNFEWTDDILTLSDTQGGEHRLSVTTGELLGAVE